MCENNGNRLELVCIEKIHELVGFEACINDNTLPRIAAPLEYIAVGLIFTQNKMVYFHKSFLSENQKAYQKRLIKSNNSVLTQTADGYSMPVNANLINSEPFNSR
jgi:hypothetical protein